MDEIWLRLDEIWYEWTTTRGSDAMPRRHQHQEGPDIKGPDQLGFDLHEENSCDVFLPKKKTHLELRDT